MNKCICGHSEPAHLCNTGMCSASGCNCKKFVAHRETVVIQHGEPGVGKRDLNFISTPDIGIAEQPNAGDLQSPPVRSIQAPSRSMTEKIVDALEAPTKHPTEDFHAVLFDELELFIAENKEQLERETYNFLSNTLCEIERRITRSRS